MEKESWDFQYDLRFWTLLYIFYTTDEQSTVYSQNVSFDNEERPIASWCVLSLLGSARVFILQAIKAWL